MVSSSPTYCDNDGVKMAEQKTLLENDVHFSGGASPASGTSRNSRSTVHEIMSTRKGGDGTEVIKQPASASRGRAAVVLVGCVYLNFCSSGANIALGVVYVELIAYFDSPRSQAVLVQSVFVGVSVGCGILFTSLVVKYETGIVVVISSLIAAVSFCGSAFAPNIPVIVALIGVMAGLANSVNLLVAYVVVSWTFQKRRKAALTVLMMGSASGQMLMPIVAATLIDRVLWQGAILVMGALLFLNCVPCGLVIYYSRHCFQKGDVVKLKNSKIVDLKCLSDVAFMVFLIAYIGVLAFISVEQTFVVDMTVLKGYSADSGATLVSINGLVMTLVRVFGMIWLGIAPNTKLEWHMIYIFLGLAASHVVVTESAAYWGMVVGIIMRGCFGGLAFAFIPGLQIDMRGLELFPQTTALCNCLGGGASMLGGFVGGLTFDITESYNLVFYLAAGTSVLAAIAMVIVILVFRFRRNQNNLYEQLR